MCVRDVCSAIVDLLAIRYIMIPSGQSLQAVVDGLAGSVHDAQVLAKLKSVQV